MPESLRSISRIIPDRDPAEYFHGRAQILCDFEDLLRRSKQEKKGTIFLIQGAPGAGKSALLHELEKLALASGWETTIKKGGAKKIRIHGLMRSHRKRMAGHSTLLPTEMPQQSKSRKIMVDDT